MGPQIEVSGFDPTTPTTVNHLSYEVIDTRTGRGLAHGHDHRAHGKRDLESEIPGSARGRTARREANARRSAHRARARDGSSHEARRDKPEHMRWSARGGRVEEQAQQDHDSRRQPLAAAGAAAGAAPPALCGVPPPPVAFDPLLHQSCVPPNEKDVSPMSQPLCARSQQTAAQRERKAGARIAAAMAARAAASPALSKRITAG